MLNALSLMFSVLKQENIFREQPLNTLLEAEINLSISVLKSMGAC